MVFKTENVTHTVLLSMLYLSVWWVMLTSNVENIKFYVYGEILTKSKDLVNSGLHCSIVLIGNDFTVCMCIIPHGMHPKQVKAFSAHATYNNSLTLKRDIFVLDSIL